MSRPQRVSTDEIIKVARAHFIRRGHSASLKSIAEDLGFSHSALIQRFGSKRALLISALKPPQDFPWPTGFLAGPPPERDLAIKQLRELCEKLMKFLNAYVPQIKVLQSAGVTPQEVNQGRLPLPLMVCQRVKTWIEKGVKSGLFSSCDTAALASMIVGTMLVRANLMTLCSSHDSITNDSISQIELIGSMEGVIENMTRMLFGGGSPEEKSMSEF